MAVWFLKKNMNDNRIFVSIASYRDVQLIPTIKDLVENCSDPGRLDICVFNQFGDECPNFDVAKLSGYHGASVDVYGVPYLESKGVCWARHYIQNHYKGQKYYLQLDSHHRFVKNWDLLCEGMIEDLKNVGIKKPVLTAYLPSFDPYNDPQKRVQEPWQLNFDRFTVPEDCVFMIPSTMVNWKKLKLPMPSRFASGHFIFGPGDICSECQYDPNYWFHGEEINYSVRLFTHGYDLFNPHKVIAWHEYSRNYRGNKKVWDDIKNHEKANQNSHSRNRQLFRIEKRTIDFGKFDFGAVRTLRDYERFAGILFSKRAVQAETIACKPPPNLYNHKRTINWINSFIDIRKHCLDVFVESLPPLEDIAYIAVIYKRGNQELYREDLLQKHLIPLYNEMERDGYKHLRVWTSFKHPTLPDHAIVWPYVKDVGWTEEKIEFNFRQF